MEHDVTTPANAIEIVKKLNASISKLDGAHAEEYQKNTEVYTKELTDLDQSFRDVIDHADRKEIIVEIASLSVRRRSTVWHIIRLSRMRQDTMIREPLPFDR